MVDEGRVRLRRQENRLVEVRLLEILRIRSGNAAASKGARPGAGVKGRILGTTNPLVQWTPSLTKSSGA